MASSNYTARDVLELLDHDARQSPAFFPDFDHGCYYHVDGRLAVLGTPLLRIFQADRERSCLWRQKFVPAINATKYPLVELADVRQFVTMKLM
jgi:hypothetical protein